MQCHLKGPAKTSIMLLQFNFDVEELDIAQRELEHWRRDPSCPMIIEVQCAVHMMQQKLSCPSPLFDSLSTLHDAKV